jgi:hypothetical protein
VSWQLNDEKTTRTSVGASEPARKIVAKVNRFLKKMYAALPTILLIIIAIKKWYNFNRNLLGISAILQLWVKS